MRKLRVVGRIYGMKHSWKGPQDRNRHKNRTKRRGQVRLVYVKDIKMQQPHHVKGSPWGSECELLSEKKKNRKKAVFWKWVNHASFGAQVTWGQQRDLNSGSRGTQWLNDRAGCLGLAASLLFTALRKHNHCRQSTWKWDSFERLGGVHMNFSKDRIVVKDNVKIVVTIIPMKNNQTRWKPRPLRVRAAPVV